MAEVPQSLSLVNAGTVALKVFLAEVGQNSHFILSFTQNRIRCSRVENKVAACLVTDELLGRARLG